MSNSTNPFIESHRVHEGTMALVTAVNFFVFIVIVSSLFGCSSNHASEIVYTTETTRGTINRSLPSEVQEQQEAVSRLLNGLLEGIGDASGMEIFVPGIDFQEPFERFFESSKRLVRWEFGPTAKEGSIPVILYFDDQESGPVNPASERRVERTYLVSGNRFEASIVRQ